MTKAEEFIGVDAGTVRTGLARGNMTARIAQPLKTVPTSDVVEELARLAGELQAAGIVVGQPRNLAGDETQQTKAVQAWVKEVKQKINLPFYAQDEALTSTNAQASKAGEIDAAAAALILQDFLDTSPAERVAW